MHDSGHFDEWADRYDGSVRRLEGYPFEGYDRVLEQIVHLAAPRATHHILDLGIGTGNLAARFAVLGCRISGIDFSVRMLAVAANKVPGARLARADIRGPWPPEFSGPYDRIVSAYTFHHLDLSAKVRLLVRLFDVHLVAGGCIVVGDVCFPTPAALREERARVREAWDESEHYWVATETVVACTQAGLQAEHSQISRCAGVCVFRRPSPTTPCDCSRSVVCGRVRYEYGALRRHGGTRAERRA
ncbi:MAG: methyltransferase domain-containing protein [Candidatus Eisenbacteria bacterium]